MGKIFWEHIARALVLLALACTAVSGHAGETAPGSKAPAFSPAATPAATPGATPAASPAPAVTVEPVPGWVTDRALPQASKARIASAESGTAYLLVDEQYLTRTDGHDNWFRTASMVTNRSGLEAGGQISVTYDPAFESVSVNFIHLIRDGKVIDLTRETAFRVVEHEDDLDDGIISGTLKSIANLRDVQVGDIIDYAVTTHTRSSLWPGHAFYHFSERYSDAVARRTLRLVWPPAMTPQYKAINSRIAFPARKTATGTEWEWTAEDPPAMQSEDNVPATAFQWGRVDVSTMKDWAEVARWAAALYQGDETLPDDFTARLDAIARASSAPGERFTAAARFVQDNIRYVGEELGEGSYVPRRPKTVLTRGYGDCKDKSLLLAIALRRLGIDAVPALVSTVGGARLPDRLPSPLLFNHMIVRAVVDGQVIWIDATGTHRGGRGTAIVPSDLGYALPIRAGQTALERISGYAEHAGRETVLEQFAVDEKGDVPLTLHVETRYTAARADNMRAYLAANSAKTSTDNNLKFYRDRFPGLVESKPLEITDDRDGNVLTMTENYSLSREAFGKAKIGSKLITRAYAIQNVLPARQPNPRVLPLALSDDLVNEHRIELRATGRVLEGLDDVDEKAGPIAFARRSTKLPDGLRMDYTLDTGTQDDVPASAAEAIYALSDKIKDAAGIEWYLDKTARIAAVPPGFDPAIWPLIKADIEQAGVQMQKNDEPSRLEALSLLSSAAAKVAHPSPTAGLIDGMKGAILAELQRPQAALAALQSATAQYDGNPPVFRLWIAFEIDLGTPDSVTRAMLRTGKLHPDVIATLDKRWVRVIMQKAYALPADQRERTRGDLCIALAEGGWQQAPRSALGANMLGCAVAAHSLRGEVAAARASLAKDLPTDALLNLALDRRHQALWPDLDRIGSDHFRKSLEREADRAGVAAKAAPKDYAAAMYQLQTLRALGRFQDALDAGKPLATDKTQIEVVGSDAFWLVNEYAGNLRALGRMDEALAAMDTVLSLGFDRYPELVSLAINRTEIVIAAGRYQDGLDNLNAIEAQQMGGLSAYGKMWVWANKACALRALGQGDAANAADAKLAADPASNWSAATEAAVCRKDTRAIVETVLKRLRSDDARTTVLDLFVTSETPEGRTPYEQGRLKVLKAALALPEVQSELAKYGRSIRYAGTSQGLSDF